MLTVRTNRCSQIYAGKYLSACIFLLIGGTSIVLDVLGFGYAFLVQVLYLIIMALDVFALYSESFTDSNGKIIASNSMTLVYSSLEEREKMLFVDKLNKIACIGCVVVFYLLYFIIREIVL
jgi:hypothetical protein